MLAGRDAVPAGVVTQPCPRAAPGNTGSGALRTPVGPGPVKGQSPGCRGGAPVGETQRYTASDPQATDQPDESRDDLRAIQVTRQLGAPYPLLRGKAKGDG